MGAGYRLGYLVPELPRMVHPAILRTVLNCRVTLGGDGIALPGPPDARLTPQRRAVLDALRSSTDHPTAQDVFHRVSRTAPGIGFATVYRALDMLVASGQARELSLGDAAARFDANVDEHDHLVCDGCGRAVDLDPALTTRVLNQVSVESGFEVTGYDLQFRGRCPGCRDAGVPRPARHARSTPSPSSPSTPAK